LANDTTCRDRPESVYAIICKKAVLLAGAIALFVLICHYGQSCSTSAAMTEPNQAFVYPQPHQANQVDDYHGTQVADPYRWLEDPDSDETKAWIEAENKLTFGLLETIPARDRLKQRLTQLWNYEKYGIPFKQGERYFYFKNDGLQNQSVLYTLKLWRMNPSSCLTPTLFRKTVPWHYRDSPSAKMGSTLPMGCPHLAPTGKSGKCARWRAAWIQTIASSG
jgi:hypothetical protein